MKMTASDVLIDAIHDWGVDVVFGLPGDGINGIMEALRKRADKIRFVQVRHEEAAAFMACAYAKYTGKLGVCLGKRALRNGENCKDDGRHRYEDGDQAKAQKSPRRGFDASFEIDRTEMPSLLVHG